MKSSSFGFGQNKFSVNAKANENEGLEIGFKDSNLDIASKQQQQFYDKIEQANQIGKQLSNNASSIQKQAGDLASNAEKLSMKELGKDINVAKSTVKQAENISSSITGFGKSIKNAENAFEKNISTNASVNIDGGFNIKVNDNSAFGFSGLKSVQKQAESTGKQLGQLAQNVENIGEKGLSLNNSLNSNLIGNQSIKINENKLGLPGFKQASNLSESSIKYADKMIKDSEKVYDSTKNQYSEAGGLSFGNTKNFSNIGAKVDQLNPLGRLEDEYKNDLSKVNQFSSDMNKNFNSLNESYNEANRQIGSLNPFVQKNDLANFHNINNGFEKTVNGVNSLVKSTNGQYISKALEQETQDNSVDISSRNPFQQSQFNKFRPDPVNTNQSESVLAAKQGKRIFQQELPQNSLQVMNNGKNLNSSQVIQVYDEKEEKVKAGKMLKNIPWALLGIIGLWTFIFMISDIIDYSNWKFVQENSLTNVASWYSSDLKMQQAALGYNGGLGRNYISLIDFILFYYITKIFYNLWLTNEYFAASTIKNLVTVVLFLKDITVIILALTAGNYSSFSGWSGFGFFWLSTFAKISIILSFSKIFFFRLNYFRQFSQQKDCCCHILTNWGNSLYNWASAGGQRNAELMLSLLIFGLYIPLILHCIVGIIESTYVLIIWISILFFLQQFIQLCFEICKPRSEQGNKNLVQRLLDSQKQGISELAGKFWVYFTLLYVIIPGVASVSFGANFKNAIQFHFNGQQLMFNFFSIPASGSGYEDTMTFICNLLSLI
ncbi:transmembrane protein, putative (macronuclear) [Tetrahymena thermophila SB210]|uniref:Transmembrane protein, putative n=1 Tax=Tetrahymena thermophila (strain SB210) TaxID=312017 RepID=Q23KH5_TETTS|nr:transmembrane protein, putative [Tetrahymena thermophila SB210]EAR96868.1 transmembrane protein, putative [Tetrahymena thermophila SB210]|eukprot:XP_001017113.1 transmembrane protein, putative [Tetrahymena thermophila SB210]